MSAPTVGYNSQRRTQDQLTELLGDTFSTVLRKRLESSKAFDNFAGSVDASGTPQLLAVFTNLQAHPSGLPDRLALDFN